MPNWLLAILTPLIEKLATRIGKLLISKIKGTIDYNKAVKDYDKIKDPQARAAYIKSKLN